MALTPTNATIETKPATVTKAGDKEGKAYQTYNSSLPNQKLVTEKGRVIHVVSSQYITDNEEEIEYLDSLIAGGFQYMTKGKSITSAELDPMAALRAKIKAELMAEMEPTSPKLRDLGTTAEPKLKPASTEALKSIAAGSESK